MLKQILESFGLKETEDFIIVGDWFTKVAKTRTIQVDVHHPEIPAIYHGSTIITPSVPAWTEQTQVEETYYANFPSDSIISETLHAELIKDENISDLVSAFLSDKQHLVTEDDSINIHNNKIHNWSFKNIAKPTNQQLSSVILTKNQMIQRQEKLKQIADLEKQITTRRVREALVSGDNSFIVNIENQIIAIRNTL